MARELTGQGFGIRHGRPGAKAGRRSPHAKLRKHLLIPSEEIVTKREPKPLRLPPNHPQREKISAARQRRDR